MSVLPILQWPDPRLSRRCDPVDGCDVGALVRDMFETMYAAPGRGLAAPQVGAMRRVFVMDTTWKDGDMSPVACIDPEIVAASDRTETGTEGCLSIPGVTADVMRPAEITLRWRDPSGAMQERRLTGFEARCAQHELDHLDGLVTFDRVAPEMRARLAADYAARGA